MPRKIPTNHKHEPPGAVVPMAQGDPNHCSNDARIAAIERHLADLADMDARLKRVEQHEQLPAVQAEPTTGELVPVIDQQILEQRFAGMMRQIDTLRQQVAQVETLSPDDINGLSVGLNERINAQVDQAVGSLKIRVSTIERSSAPSLATEVEQLGKIVIETGKLVHSLDDRARDLENSRAEIQGQFQEMNRAFSANMAVSLRAVLDTFEGKAA